MSDELTRLSVNMNQETADALRAIAVQKGISHTEVVRRCISVYEHLLCETEKGRSIRLESPDGKEVEMIFL